MKSHEKNSKFLNKLQRLPSRKKKYVCLSKIQRLNCYPNKCRLWCGGVNLGCFVLYFSCYFNGSYKDVEENVFFSWISSNPNIFPKKKIVFFLNQLFCSCTARLLQRQYFYQLLVILEMSSCVILTVCVGIHAVNVKRCIKEMKSSKQSTV